MLQESLGGAKGGGESSSSAKKALAKAHKALQLASTAASALPMRTLREALEECLRPEASSSMKALGYRLAETAPKCMTHELWRLVLEACTAELDGSSENAPVLVAAIPVLAQIPGYLVLGFFACPDKNAMNRLRAVLTHEHSSVRVCAITAIAKLTLDVAVRISGDGLFAFPFESHEARICCQQDIWTILIDCWKLIFQAIALDSPPQVSAVAVSALRELFARSSTMAPFFPSLREASRGQAPMNDVAAAMYKQAFPRIRGLMTAARAMPMKNQTEAALWLAMLLYTMMERSGARCPSVSVPCLDVDVIAPEESDGENDDDDEDPPAPMERVRVDQLAIDLLESWIFPVVTRRATLTQATEMCRAAFIMLAHPLLTFTRLRWAAQLVDLLVAQCYFASKTSNNANNANTQLELSEMLVKTFAWLSSTDCVSLFARTTEALFLLDQEEVRRELIQALMDTTVERVVLRKAFHVLEAVCALPAFRIPQGSSRLSPRANGLQLFQALAHSLALATDNQGSSVTSLSPELDAPAKHEAQRLVLRAFVGVLMVKRQATFVFTSAQRTHETMRCYMAILTTHFQHVLDNHVSLKSLDFFQRELYPVVLQVTPQSARLQLLALAVRLRSHHQVVVSCDALLAHLQFEVAQFVDARSDAENNCGNSAFEDGLLGGGGDDPEGANSPWNHEYPGVTQGIDTLRALSECMKQIAQLQPDSRPTLQGICHQLFAALTDPRRSVAVAAQQYRILSEIQALLASPPPGADELVTHTPVILLDLFDSDTVFLPRRRYVHHFQAGLPECKPRDEHRDPVTVTGSADPVALQVSHYQPLVDQEDVIALEINCCNLTTWPLRDLAVRLLPVAGSGVVRCVDAVQDLKLRFLRAGETVNAGASGGSSSLLPFGMLKAEKRLRVRRLTRVAFALQAVFIREGDTEGSAEASDSSIRLAPSDRYVVHFDAFFRLPQPQLASSAFFQHRWKSETATASWGVEYLETKGDAMLSLCQRVLRRLSSRLLAVKDLQLDLPSHLHTKWGDYVTASLTMSVDPLASQSALGESDSLSPTTRWSGVLEVRSTHDNTREMAKWPEDAIRIFGGGQVQRRAAPAPVTRRAVNQERAPLSTDTSHVATATPHAEEEDAFQDCTPPTDTSRSEVNYDAVGNKTAMETPQTSEQLRPVESALLV